MRRGRKRWPRLVYRLGLSHHPNHRSPEAANIWSAGMNYVANDLVVVGSSLYITKPLQTKSAFRGN